MSVQNSKTSSVLDNQNEFLFPCVATLYRDPIVLDHANGALVTDIEGKEYIDFFGGILTVSLGHCHPEVVNAMTLQAKKLGHTSTLYASEPQVTAAKKLAELTPGELKKTFFTNSGSEANETAVMLAKIHTGQHEIIALRHGYSGRTHLSVSLTAHGYYRSIPTPVAGIKHALAPYCYRCPLDKTPTSCSVECANDIEELIQTTTTGQPAAFLAEPIMGVGGFITPHPDYFSVAVGIVRKHGGLFICDEVQTAFGRTGEHWFGIEHWGVIPDIMTMAKGIANGMPVGATVATGDVANSWTGATISTFGGNPVAMAATNATIRTMEKERIPERAKRLGNKLRAALNQFKKDFNFIGDVRGMGLMQALELVEDRTTKAPAKAKTAQLLETAKQSGLLLGKGGLYGNVIRIAPPMLITEDEIDIAIERLGRALATL